MHQLTLRQFKSNKSKKKVAALIPYSNFIRSHKIKLGLLEGKATFKIHKDFKISDEKFLKS